MRRRISRGVLSAIALVTLFAPSSLSFGNDFSALLSDLRYQNEVTSTVPSYVSDGSRTVAAAAQVPADVPVPSPATAGLALPPEAAAAPAIPIVPEASAEVLPPAPATAEPVSPLEAPVTQPMPQPPVDANYGAPASGNCSSCNHQACGCNRHGGSCKDGYCQPYTMPQLPYSSFYQYWRTNSCNVHVWQGFRNECRPPHSYTPSQGGCLDGLCPLKLHRKRSACDLTERVDCGDCGPLPAEWSAGCDS